MIITSVYVSHSTTAAAIAVLSVKNGITVPINIWQSQPGDNDTVAATLRVGWRAERFVINPGRNPLDSDFSLTKMLLKEKSINAKTSVDFSALEGVSIYQMMVDKGQFAHAAFDGWPVLREEIEQVQRSQSCLLMAFFQGLIESKKNLASRMPLLGATVGSGGVQPAPNGVYIPVSSWANGTL